MCYYFSGQSFLLFWQDGCFLLACHGVYLCDSNIAVSYAKPISPSISDMVQLISFRLFLMISYDAVNAECEEQGRKQTPCFTPVSDLNSSARFVPQITLAVKSVYNILMIEKSLSGTP